MDEHARDFHYRVELAYAQNDNFLFKEKIYHDSAKLWLHKDLAEIVKTAAKDCFNRYKMRFVLYDGLRTTDAQEAMSKTQAARANPHWMEEPRLLSPPGVGGHPRGMAIDIGLETLEGTLVDMGTVFDYLAENAHPEHNPAHREHNHPSEIMNNRKLLDDPMNRAADKLNRELFLLPQEWWDFRLPPHISNQYAPISENDLPPDMRLLNI